MKLSPKARRNALRIFPFGLIWLLTGWVFILVEVAAMGTPDPNSPTIIGLNFKVFIFASIAVLIVGLIVGAIEIIFVEKLFRKRSFPQKILYKLGFYTLIMLVIITITYPIAASFESNISLVDPRVWQKFYRYLFSVTFLSTLLQMASSLVLCLIYAAINENIGHAVLVNFFTGKYHSPKEENRIFMFLDMKSSTAFAEQLGHIKYFDLLKDYYSDLSDSIINHFGEVYQYIGDEVVVSWTYKSGINNNNCIKCFFGMKKDLENRSNYYLKKFGVKPSFKAGMHMGTVTTGEIGALKKEIFFTGDVLNTTARIQSLCSQYQTDLLISGELIKALDLKKEFICQSLGKTFLKGKSEPMELFIVKSDEIANPNVDLPKLEQL